MNHYHVSTLMLSLKVNDQGVNAVESVIKA